MFRLLLIIWALLLSLIITDETSASYIPGDTIAMTGSNSDVRFDVAKVLYDYQMTDASLNVSRAPALETTTPTPTFTGAFYGSGIGWIEFASGSNQVKLNCSESLTALIHKCTFSGSGWSENVGDIDFSHVEYNPATGRLEGTGGTFVGDIDFDGIALPLRKVELKETTFVANHDATLTVSGAWMYDAGDTPIWDISISPMGGIYAPVISKTHGTFSADLSLATSYQITITDTNGSITTISPFIVNSGLPSTTIINTTPPFFAKTFCSSYTTDSNCPDGADRLATTLVQLPTGAVVANGSDVYTITPKVRDTYGNRVTVGSTKIVYSSTVKNIQAVDSSYIDPACTQAIDITGGFSYPCFGKLENNSVTTDISYNVSSTAPTNLDNKIQLDSVEYNSGTINIPLTISSLPLTFSPLYTAEVVRNTDAPVISSPYTFSTRVDKNGSAPGITPTIISILKIGSSVTDEWHNLTSDPTKECANYPLNTSPNDLCNWGGPTDRQSVIATKSDSDFSFTGTYTTSSTNPEATDIRTYIYYINAVSTKILYESTPSTAVAATTGIPRIRVLGQSGEGLGGGGANSRVGTINDIRKQIALLSRNRGNYNTTDYIVYDTHTDKTITDTDFDSKRTIIVVGADIIINNNIAKKYHPLALIALADASGNGGNIIIDGSVRDINSSLIAEHAITSGSSDYQLYIYGSLVSANPPREIASTTCPYFAASNCGIYDLPDSRAGFSFLPSTTTGHASDGGSAYPNPLVIQSDPRLIADPPPAMSK